MSNPTASLLEGLVKKALSQSVIVIVLLGGLYFLWSMVNELKATNTENQKALINYMMEDRVQLVKALDANTASNTAQLKATEEMTKKIDDLVYTIKRRP